jgi:hypothetical protein
MKIMTDHQSFAGLVFGERDKVMNIFTICER